MLESLLKIMFIKYNIHTNNEYYRINKQIFIYIICTMYICTYYLHIHIHYIYVYIYVAILPDLVYCSNECGS